MSWTPLRLFVVADGLDDLIDGRVALDGGDNELVGCSPA
jgi:hypothetical protein